MRKLCGLAAFAACIALPAVPATTATVQLDSRTFDGTNWLFTYGGTLAPTEGVLNGSRLIILDFGGYVAGSISSALPDITASIEMSSSVLGLLGSITDDPTIPNLVFTYVGAPFQVDPPSGTPYDPIDFTGLSAKTTFGALGADGFAAYTVKNTGGTFSGSDVYSTGSLAVPSAVPEPGTWGMALVGMAVVGFAMRRRSNLRVSFT